MMADNDGTREREDSVSSRILAWSSSRPLWQQDALRRIVLDGPPDERAIHEILALCKKEHGDESVQLTAEPLSKDHLPIDLGKGESVSLASIGNVVGVNQLAPRQTLAFCPAGLTIRHPRFFHAVRPRRESRCLLWLAPRRTNAAARALDRIRSCRRLPRKFNLHPSRSHACILAHPMEWMPYRKNLEV